MAEEIDDFPELEFSIEGFEDTSLTNGENAFIIYLIVDNKTQKSRKINLLKATYITSQREQLEQDIWITGYITGEATLRPNSFKKAGLVFYKSKLKSISDSDSIYISLHLIQEGVELSLSFQKKENTWLLINKEKKENSKFLINKEKIDVDLKLTPKQLEIMLLKKIERFEAFEEKSGVYFDKVSLKVNTDFSITIFSELHSINGATLENGLDINCFLYDTDDSILAKTNRFILKDSFMGFEIFDLGFNRPGIANEVSKIRLYPKKF